MMIDWENAIANFEVFVSWCVFFFLLTVEAYCPRIKENC